MYFQIALEPLDLSHYAELRKCLRVSYWLFIKCFLNALHDGTVNRKGFIIQQNTCNACWDYIISLMMMTFEWSRYKDLCVQLRLQLWDLLNSFAVCLGHSWLSTLVFKTEMRKFKYLSCEWQKLYVTKISTVFDWCLIKKWMLWLFLCPFVQLQYSSLHFVEEYLAVFVSILFYFH